ncbi:hypothetical protein KQ3_04928 [Bacillus cereus B5-2]|nr:hypothetical protein KQ3_04928 [Bacillus cereus B5-2]
MSVIFSKIIDNFTERLGHADVRITLDIYIYLLLSMQRDTAIKFGKILFDKGYIEINLD